MSDTRRERNQNFIAWQAVKGGSVFTPNTPVDWSCRLLESIEWTEESSETLSSPDEDILRGHVKTFDSMDQMIQSLDEPW